MSGAWQGQPLTLEQILNTFDLLLNCVINIAREAGRAPPTLPKLSLKTSF